jgi:hypothetical protein
VLVLAFACSSTKSTSEPLLRSGASGVGDMPSSGGSSGLAEAGGGGTDSGHAGAPEAGGSGGSTNTAGKGGTPNGGSGNRGSGGSSGKVGSSPGGSTGKAGSGAQGGMGAAGGSDSSGGTGGQIGGAAGMPPNPCLLDGGCPAGEWINVTPSTVSLTDGDCGNFGTKTVQADPKHPQDIYTFYFCQGLWKSSDYGQTWQGPINKGDNAAKVTDCAGGITLGPTDGTHPPLMWLSCIRGDGLGFWKSLDGGVTWTSVVVTNTPQDATGQQFYPPIVDPYDNQHLLMAGHANNFLLESVNGGDTWKTLTLDPGMTQNTQGGTWAPAFIDNGNPADTRKTWLFIAAMTGGLEGTWRTTDAGATWTHVDNNEHINGGSQIYQPDTKGSIFMPGVYSGEGWGVLYSSDFGLTWQHVGGSTQESVVIGTPKNLYAAYGWGVGAGGEAAPSLEVSSLPGTGDWATPGTPMEMTQGPAEGAVTSDGKNNIVFLANYNAGLWRYVEP